MCLSLSHMVQWLIEIQKWHIQQPSAKTTRIKLEEQSNSREVIKLEEQSNSREVVSVAIEAKKGVGKGAHRSIVDQAKR